MPMVHALGQALLFVMCAIVFALNYTLMKAGAITDGASWKEIVAALSQILAVIFLVAALVVLLTSGVVTL